MTEQASTSPSSRRKWRLSAFTRVVTGNSGELLLHNSFMGAVARIPDRYRRALAPLLEAEFVQADVTADPLRELCASGFFVPSDIDESSRVKEIVDRERESGFHLIVLPHENCNFRCVYCYEAFARGQMKPEVAAGLRKFVASKVEEVDWLTVSWFGGEPLLARKCLYALSDSFLADCRRCDVPFSSGITTNGYLLSEDVVDELLRRQVTSYQVTLDGPEELHNRARRLAGGRETYQRILRNLDGMHCRREDFSVKLRVNFGPHHTIPVMEQFLGEIRRRFEADPRFDLHFHPVGRWGGPNDSELEVCGAGSAGTVRTTLVSRAIALGFAGGMLKERLRSHGNVCYAGMSSSIVVGSDGRVFKCTVALDDPINHVGWITTEGELKVDRHRWELWTTLSGKDAAKCESCSFSPSCQSRGCPLSAIKRQEPPCPLTPEEYEDAVRLVAGTAPIGPAGTQTSAGR